MTSDYLDRRIDYTDPDFAPLFDELPFWSSRFGALLFENLELRPGIRILDLGCASGFPLFELAQVSGRSCRLVGVDTWPHALQRAARKRAYYALDNVAVARADASTLPFAAGSFQLVVSNLGINNFDDPPAALVECARILAPGGRLALTTNLVGHMREFYAVYRGILRTFGNQDYIDRLARQEGHRKTVEELSEMLDAAGLSVTKAVRSEFRMRYVDAEALLNHWLTKLGFLDGWRAVVDPADEREIFRRLEEALDEWARAAGSLTMTIPMLYLEAIAP